MTSARTDRVRRLCLALGLWSAIGLTAATRAPAAPTQESMFQDDKLLVYSSPARVARTLDTLRALGVDRVRVSVFWSVVAPNPTSKRRPSFDAADPGAYPPGSWDRYDTIVTDAAARGIAVDFDITSPAPFWATGHPPRKDLNKNWFPSAHEFDLFVRAVGRRYDGSYVPGVSGASATPAASTAPAGGRGGASPRDLPPIPSAPGSGSQPTPQPVPQPSGPPSPGAQPASAAATAAGPPPLARVTYWSIWNEPNQPGWLSPQWVRDPRHRNHFVESSPSSYRGLVDGAADGLLASGHANDTILVGETAPKGLNVQGTTRAIKPLHFIRLLYCLDDHYHALSGALARQQGCPTTAAQRRGFLARHPALFLMTGWAHHPYELSFPPDKAERDPDYATIANLPHLTAVLDRIMRVYRVPRPPIPLFLTEYGYLTKPPTPLGVTLAQQAAYLDQSQFIAYINPRVRTLSQFQLTDDHPKAGISDPVAAYGGTFQTGLEFANGRHKPSYASYRMPIYLPFTSVRPGHTLRVWGMLRSAPHGTRQRAEVQFQALHSRRGYRRIATVSDDGARGFIDSDVRIPGAGSVRLAWSTGSQTLYSRTVAVRAG